MSLLRRNRIKKKFLRRRSRRPSSRTKRKTKIVSTKNVLLVNPRTQRNLRRKLELKRSASRRTMLLAKHSLTKKPKISAARTRTISMLRTSKMRKKGRSAKITKPLKPTSRESKTKMPKETVPPKKRPTRKDKPPRMLRRHALERKSKMLKTHVMKPNVRRNSFR